MLTIALLFCAGTLTSILSGVIGMAGGVTLLAFMSFFLELHLIVPIHGVVQLASNSSRAYFLRRSIHRPYFLAFLCGTPLGTLGAYLLLDHLKSEKLLLIPLILIISYSLFKPKKLPSLKIEKKGFIFLGVLTSFLSPLIGATGPILAPFFLRDDLTKEEIVSTKAIMQTLTHFFKIPLFLSLSFDYTQYSFIIFVMVGAALIGTRIGTILLGRVSPRLFILCYKVAMFAALLRLIYKISRFSIG